jgi:hypothetical protein
MLRGPKKITLSELLQLNRETIEVGAMLSSSPAAATRALKAYMRHLLSF